MQSDSASFSKYSLYSEKDSRIFTVNLSCKSMHDKLLNTIKVTPTSVLYWNEKIDHLDEYVWKQIFLIPRSATIGSKGGFPVMAKVTRILAANIPRQFFFVITTTASTRCLVQNFQLICYSHE